MLHHRSWTTEFYVQSWGPVSAIFGLTVTVAVTLYLQSQVGDSIRVLPILMAGLLAFPRITQCVFVLYSSLNQSYNPWFFFRMQVIDGMMGGCATIFLFIILAHPMDTARIPWIACIVIHWLLFSLDGFYFIEIARYRAEKTVLTWLESKLSRDSIPAGGRPALKAKLFNFWSGLWQSLRRGQGAIVLSDDDDPPIEPSVPFTVPTQLYDDVFDWLRLTGDPSTRKVLWITVDRHKINTCVSDTIEFLSAVDKTISVDASRARSIFWPLLCGLGVAWPEFKQQLAWSLVECGFDYTEEGPLHRLLFRPLEEIWKIDHRNSGGDYESQQPEEIPLVVIHSIRDLAQARELCDIMEDVILKKSLNIIAISTRELRKFSWGQRYKMEHSHTLSLSETGTVINSGKLPWFHKNLFLLVLEGIFRSPKEVYERLSIELYGPAASSLFERPELSDPSTLTVFHLLHKAAEDRKQILKFLSDLPMISQSEINNCINYDNVDIAWMLQRLVGDEAYKQDIPRVPKEEGFSVLNLTHHILARRLPWNHEIQDNKLFRRRAHRLLSILADFLNILPEELAIHGVVLLSDRPVKFGGFADIYHGQYTNSEGVKVEVALKVLRAFQDQSYGNRNLLLQKFAKEALVWRYLKHRNIVPFLGIDATTFPTPAMALVSHWMSQGNILNYMAENSPVFRYAISLLNDVIQGLVYLHSQNVVHGDLCGRNILIDGQRAYLTDFGLAAFVELDTSIKTSTRKGSTRWMAPELLLPNVYHPGLPFRQTPASDVWAFGCVCCEIWSEGQIPFVDMSDGGIILALSGVDAGAVPYKTKPCDKAGIPMPERLWELVTWCFKLDGAERPSVNVIADIISEIKQKNRFSSGLVPGWSPVQPQSSGSTSALPDEIHPQAVVDRKGKQRVRFAEEYTLVRFGPLHLDGADIEELFDGILEDLVKLVRRDVLTAPLRVDKHHSQYLHLQFRSPVEANSFAMTWMVYRYDPHTAVSAVVVDT